MKKIITAILVSLIVLVVAVLCVNRDQTPPGEGSYREAQEIDATLKAIDPSEFDAELAGDCYRFTHDDGFSYIAIGTDKSSAWGWWHSRCAVR